MPEKRALVVGIDTVYDEVLDQKILDGLYRDIDAYFELEFDKYLKSLLVVKKSGVCIEKKIYNGLS